MAQRAKSRNLAVSHLPHQLRVLGERYKHPSGVCDTAPENLDSGVFWDLRNHIRMSDNCFYTAAVCSITQRLQHYTRSLEIKHWNPETPGQTWRVGNTRWSKVQKNLPTVFVNTYIPGAAAIPKRHYSKGPLFRELPLRSGLGIGLWLGTRLSFGPAQH